VVYIFIFLIDLKNNLLEIYYISIKIINLERQISDDINKSSLTNNILPNSIMFNSTSNNIINIDRRTDINHTSNSSTINNSLINSGNNVFINDINYNNTNNNNSNSIPYNPQNSIRRRPNSNEQQGPSLVLGSLPNNNNLQNVFDFRLPEGNIENNREINNNDNIFRNLHNPYRNENNTLSVNDIYENVINTNLNENFNQFERPIYSRVVSNSRRFQNAGANIYSARYTEQFRRNRDIANFIFEGLESEGSSSDDQNIFGNSLNNCIFLYYYFFFL